MRLFPAFWIFALALAVRVVLLYATDDYRRIEWPEPVRVMNSLAADGQFAQAFSANSGPTAHVAPLYPLLAAPIFVLIKSDAGRQLALELFSSVLTSLHYALLPLLGAVIGVRARVGITAGLLGALLPINRWVQMRGVFEYALTALLVLVLSIFALHLWGRGPSLRRGAVLGLLAGLTLLAGSQVAPLLLFIWLYPLLRYPRQRRQYAESLLIAGLLAAALLSPWVIRNYLVLGSPIWSRSNFGFELNLSNSDRASPVWDENKDNGLLAEQHPLLNARQCAEVTALGEVRYNQLRKEAAYAWISSHPAPFGKLTLERAWLFWFPEMHLPVQTLALSLITVLGFAGLALLARSGSQASWYFGAMWIAFWGPACLFQQSGRMRFPIEWSLFFLAAYAIVEFRPKLSRP